MLSCFRVIAFERYAEQTQNEGKHLKLLEKCSGLWSETSMVSFSTVAQGRLRKGRVRPPGYNRKNGFIIVLT